MWGDVRFSTRYDLETQVAEIARFYRIVHEAGVLPVSAGGDHFITYPIFKGIAAHRPVGLIHIDAHTDTWGQVYGSKFTHAAPFRLAVEDGLLDPARTIQIGIRGGQNQMDGIEFSERHGMRVVFMEEFRQGGSRGHHCRGAARGRATAPPISLSTSDGLDPVYTPGTGTPEIGGISTLDAQRFLYGAARTQSGGRRRGRSRAALRSDRQHRPGRRRA